MPGHIDIELIAFYEEFRDYYPLCELQTKRWFVENVHPDWTIFDVGANIGYYSVLFSRLAPAGRVHAFEPTETAAMLRANLAHNKCANVDVHEIALGIKSGDIEENIYRIWGRPPERKIYKFETIDRIVAEIGIDRLDCLKIDVDSYDFEVLQGAEQSLERFNPWIVVEMNHALSTRNQSVNQALEWLRARKYRRALVLDYENFALRRDTEMGGEGSEASMTLVFEQRPIFVRSGLRKGSPIGFFFSEAATAHGKTSFVEDPSPSEGIVALIPGPQWSYGVSFARQARASDAVGPLVIEVDISVSRGAAGIGCLGRDFIRYCSKEAIVQPAADFVTITIEIEDARAVSALMIRNCDPAGNDMRATIKAIRVYSAEPALDSKLPPMLSPDKTTISLDELAEVIDQAEGGAVI